MAEAKTKGVRYVGRYDEVEVRLPDGESYARVPRGEVLTTSAEHADGLLAQAGEWQSAAAKYDPETPDTTKEGEK